ncbi:predicted protein [Nematostella vectensis]|uniref:Uncharacterized protein n=1 Tax=Nematostella vectensis TaxID=45351 RepID=A7SIM1_NEMVE|nr:predicted protein [Nematostella vectensis]|eukprot:XP_001628480.1 predicted protein [Nematostella vectensis]
MQLHTRVQSYTASVYTISGTALSGAGHNTRILCLAVTMKPCLLSLMATCTPAMLLPVRRSCCDPVNLPSLKEDCTEVYNLSFLTCIGSSTTYRVRL